MTDSTIHKTVFFQASRERVWAFLTEKDKLAIWFHPAEADLAPGEDYALVRPSPDGEQVRQCWGTVQRMEPPSLLVYSFTIKPLNGVLTTVTWTLEEVLGGTKLTLKHEGLDAAGSSALGLLTALDAGWDKHFAGLREAVSSE